MSEPLIELDGVVRRYGDLTAVNQVSLVLRAGVTLGVVGEPGSGKSTLARLIVGLERPNAGTLRYRGATYGRSARSLQPIRRRIGMVFQDPYDSLDARFTVRELVAEPMRAHGTWRDGGDERVRLLLERVGLGGVDPSVHPTTMSGGQRQRIGIARALALDPEILICDEPTSALDVSVQAQILNLLLDLQRERELAIMMISHDLHVVRRMSDEVVVMYGGSVVERGPTPAVTGSPRHPYTRTLLDAVPGRSPDERRLEREPNADLLRDVSDVGCPFGPRCWLADERCRTERPLLDQTSQPTACHYPLLDA